MSLVGPLVATAPPAAALGSVLFVAPTGTDSPNTCTVAGSPCRTITYALTQAAVAATINVSGTIADHVVVNNPGVTITGAKAPAGSPAIIDGSATGRVIDTGVNLNLDRLTIRNGSAGSGGGGGIFAWSSSGTTRLTNVVVTGNVTTGAGGGILSSGALVISNSTISGNTAQGGRGGGIYVQRGTAQVTGTSISANAARNGGGIAIGAGTSTSSGNVTLGNSTVSGNTASEPNAGDGGGIFVNAFSNLQVTTSTLTGNVAVDAGGGVAALSSSTVTIAATTIAGNKANFGGGVSNSVGNMTVAGSIVAANASSDCSNSGGSGGTWVNSYSLINDNACGGGGGTGVVTGDPVLAALGSSGGATQTMALSVNSPAANAIPVGTTVSGVQLCPRTDQAGSVAPLVSATACSMGAREPTTTEVSSPLTTLWVAAGGSNVSNSCARKASPCATVTHALSQVPPLAGDMTIRVSGTINDRITIPADRRVYTISGAGAASPAVLDGSSIGRVVTNAAGANFRLEHLRVQRGSAPSGVGGGGIFLFNGILTLFNVTVANSTAHMSGGGILTVGGTASIASSTITGNTSGLCGSCIGLEGGGGIYSQGTNLSIVNSTVSGNVSQGGAIGNGGGISTDRASTVTISGSTLSGNQATMRGGGIYAEGATITTSTITGNTAAQGGGGIAGIDNSVVKVTASTIANNTSQSFGGGGVYVQSGSTMNVGGSILSNNSGGNCTSQTSTGVVSAGYNLDSGATCGTATGDVKNVAAGLGALASNGGPTQTMLPASTSPAIGRIPSGTSLNGVTACPRTDQRGKPGPVAGQTRCTIGAAEPGAGAAPFFTSPATRTATGGTRFSLPVTTSSVFPTTLTVSPSTPLPAGVLFTDGGSGQGTLAGYASPGTYSLTLQAANGVAPNATQSFTLTVAKRPQAPITITSVNGTAGTPLPLTVTGGSGAGALSFSLGSGTAGCALSGATLTATSAGTCTVTATKAADANFAAASSAPATVTFVAELIANGGFEGSASPWILSGNAVRIGSGDIPRTGTGLLRIGGAAGSGQAYQTVSIPSTATQADLTFWLNITSDETSTTTQYDKLLVEVRSTAGSLLGTLATYGNLQKATAGVYAQRGAFSLLAFKGQTVRVQLSGSNDSARPTTFRVEDVSLRASTSNLPRFGVSPTSLSFSGAAGGANPASKSLSITNTGGGTLTWAASDDQPWLSVSPASGTAPSTVTVSVSTAGLSGGTYNGTITLSASGVSNTPVTVPVTLTVGASANDLVTNGGFEASVNPWVLSGKAFWTGSGASPHAGTGYVYLGDSNSANGSATQTVTIPSTATTANLTFWLYVTSGETTTTSQFDKLFVDVFSAANGAFLTTAATFSNVDKSAGYGVKGAFSLLAFKGQTVRIQFRVANDNVMPTTFRIDDVSIA